jgi:urease accessory protein
LASGSSALSFAARGGRTALVAAHAELPLVVQRPLYGPEGQAVVVLLTPAGALFDGDALRLQVSCGPGSDVTLASASATKLNRCERTHIAFSLDVDVSDGATFRYLVYELIPFRGTNYVQSIHLLLHGYAGASLLEVIGPGPTDDPFSYDRLDFETEVRQNGAVVVRERFVMARDSVAQLRGRTHYGSLLLFGANASAEEANEHLANLNCGDVAGASALPNGGVGLKMLGHSAQSVRETLLGAAGAPAWLRSVVPP